ncbi:MAG: hypothetical protein KDD70_03610, partial [Bdellovibrionales bacterium]|nr:hypothetical protein [Bdellovibrionales bacterium]
DRFRLLLRAAFVVPPGDLLATSVAFGITQSAQRNAENFQATSSARSGVWLYVRDIPARRHPLRKSSSLLKQQLFEELRLYPFVPK